MITHIDGGVCAPAGFVANGILAGVKKGRTKNDVAVIYSEKRCAAAGVFTTNLVKAEPVKLTRAHLKDGFAQAVIANSGNANACTGVEGAKNARRMASAVASALSVKEEDVIVCSTGVIGQQLNIGAIEKAVPSLAASLSRDGNVGAREAIMTTDTVYKEFAVETEIGGKKVRLGTMAKGSGMIHINMGTMLGFITTDCAISSKMLQEALSTSIEGTYNCVSVDGDTSTNDTLTILANGMAGNREITTKNADYNAFLAALNEINTCIARKIAADGEGAEHLIECEIRGAKDVESARKLAKSVISSSLVKAMFFGRDANWGRILCALGYSGAPFTPEKTSVTFSNSTGTIQLCKNGEFLDFDEGRAKIILSEKEIKILVEMQDGDASGMGWGCDLTYDYVKINGDYRT